ncbi:hypothetical protein DL766_004892 [Monosporascus sp. MC13-8B]|uniref:Uncharacterized protein n=1 Tax=Monosporascus cannonballus TaxID=155416 RepID=A0ABY0GUX2_9PEZI|nr:hypothetical protein DL762_008996 [Monosporascus cannonballus]RYP30414.1 hypothetical protein DL766_004892 [Monosporascus sp. MC13-8B]
MQPGMNRQTQAVNRPDGSLDVTETAKNCLWTWRNANAAPFNFRGYKAVKHGGNNHNNFVYRIGQITNDNYNKLAVRAAAGAQAFGNVDDTLSKITTARVADHGRHLIPAARNALPGVTIVEKDFGANPYYRDTWVPPASTRTRRGGRRSTGRAPSTTPSTRSTPAPASATGSTPTIAAPQPTTTPGTTGRCSGRTRPSVTGPTVAGSTNQPLSLMLSDHLTAPTLCVHITGIGAQMAKWIALVSLHHAR